MLEIIVITTEEKDRIVNYILAENLKALKDAGEKMWETTRNPLYLLTAGAAEITLNDLENGKMTEEEAENLLTEFNKLLEDL